MPQIKDAGSLKSVLDGTEEVAIQEAAGGASSTKHTTAAAIAALGGGTGGGGLSLQTLSVVWDQITPLTLPANSLTVLSELVVDDTYTNGTDITLIGASRNEISLDGGTAGKIYLVTATARITSTGGATAMFVGLESTGPYIGGDGVGNDYTKLPINNPQPQLTNFIVVPPEGAGFKISVEALGGTGETLLNAGCDIVLVGEVGSSGGSGGGLPSQWSDGGHGDVTATVDDPTKTPLTLEATAGQSAPLLDLKDENGNQFVPDEIPAPPIAVVSETDPGAIGAGRWWIQTVPSDSLGLVTRGVGINVRNATDDNWLPVGNIRTGVGTGGLWDLQSVLDRVGDYSMLVTSRISDLDAAFVSVRENAGHGEFNVFTAESLRPDGEFHFRKGFLEFGPNGAPYIMQGVNPNAAAVPQTFTIGEYGTWTGGSFDLANAFNASAAIGTVAWNASAATVQTLLNTWWGGSVFTVTGGPLPATLNVTLDAGDGSNIYPAVLVNNLVGADDPPVNFQRTQYAFKPPDPVDGATFMSTSPVGRWTGSNGVWIGDVYGTVDPSAGGGVKAGLSSVYHRTNGTAGELWVKSGASDTAWTHVTLP